MLLVVRSDRLLRALIRVPPALALAFAFAAVLVVSTERMARADDAEVVNPRAQELFSEGVHLMRIGRHAEACTKFEESLKHFNGVGTRGKLAECYERVGRIASAWRLYRDVRELSEDPARVEFAERRIEELQDRLPSLTIAAGTGIEVPGFAVTVNAWPVSPNEFGAPVPVDPGTQSIIASAPGYDTQRVTVTLAEGESRRIEFQRMTPIVTVQPRPEPMSDPGPEASPGTPTMRLASYALAGLGSAGLLTGLYFGNSALSKRGDLPEDCSRFRFDCTEEEEEILDEAIRDADRATYSLLIGGALLATGATLWLLGRSGEPGSEERTSIAPTVSGDGIGWTISGTF